MALNVFKKSKDPAENKSKGKSSQVKKINYLAGSVLLGPHIAEKSSRLQAFGAYTFRVESQANKIDIRKAVEQKYGVRVEKVTVTNLPRKKRNLGRSHGWKSGLRKAIVTLAEGQSIDLGSQ